jgi:UPF0755 protein
LRRFFQFTVVLALLAVAGAGGWLLQALRAPEGGRFPSGGVFVEMARGQSVRSMGQSLVAAGVIRSSLAFEILARWRGRQDLKAGEYHFARPASADEALARLVRGDVYYLTFIVPEGLTIFQIAQRAEDARLATRSEFLAAAGDVTLIRDVAPDARSLEGFLFPATYQFSRRVTAAEMTRAMVNSFRKEWNGLAAAPLPRGMTTLQLVTMASLVERETPASPERPQVAGVYYNRLRRGIALQCDPTVLYAMELAGRNDGIIHQSDLRLHSPYNTYRFRGLPPGPIGNPGTAALRAALAPAATDALYFVANTQGGHWFSRTLAEHARNVARYRALLREQQRNGNGAPRRAP